ncbi:hypothetical protein DL93DRAFT_2227690 [Clavulina sp. PMI_390]|nr:hypothetical protein DL93DRAFT_2227690 [Clavulina sp. PMI_390]
MPNLSKAVRAAQKLSNDASTSIVTQAVHVPSKYHLEVHDALGVSEQTRQAVWELYADNMRTTLLASSFGWDPVDKKKEIFHKHGRLLLIHAPETNRLLGFSSYRFDVDENPDEVFEDVLYIYEVQVAPFARRHGLGDLMIRSMEALASHARMLKVMLTVLVGNAAAIGLYSRAGFTVDPTSPLTATEFADVAAEGNNASHVRNLDDGGDDGEVYDYFILSKLISASQTVASVTAS